MAGSCEGRSLPVRPAHPRRWLNVRYAEDDDDAFDGRKTGVHQPYDAMDDAADVRILHPAVSQRPGFILGDVKYCGYRDTGIRYGLGAVTFFGLV